MWPFGKKKEKEQQEPSAREQQVQQFAQQFEAEEFTLVAVTGPEGLRSGKEDGQELTTLYIPLTAWMDDYDGVVHEQAAVLTALADDALEEFLRSRLPRDFIIKVEARAALEGNRFQLVGMPEPGFDPELKAILDRQKTPVTVQDEELGTFTLSRTANWFETDIKWMDRNVLLAFDAGQEQEACFAAARKLLADSADWDERMREFAVENLLDELNEQQEDEPLTREELLESLEAESILVDGEGGLTVWLGSDLLWGRSVQVTGSIEGGPEQAKIEE